MTELKNYRFNIDPTTETPAFAMTGCPNRLFTLLYSRVITGEEFSNMPFALAVMVLQAMQDRDPLAWGLHEEESQRFYGNEIWSGTAHRIAHYYHILHHSEKWKSQGKADAEAEAWHASMETPEWAAAQIALLEEHGIIIPLTCEQVRELQLAQLPPPSFGTPDREIPLNDNSNGTPKGVKDNEKERIFSSTTLNTLNVKATLNGKDEGPRPDLTHHVNLSNSSNSSNLKGSQGQGNDESSPRKGHFLTAKAEQALRLAGIEADWIRFFNNWNGYAKALNNADPMRGGVAGLVGYWKAKTEIDEMFNKWVRKNPDPEGPAPEHTVQEINL